MSNQSISYYKQIFIEIELYLALKQISNFYSVIKFCNDLMFILYNLYKYISKEKFNL